MSPKMIQVLVAILVLNAISVIFKYVDEDLEITADAGILVLSFYMLYQYIKMLPMLG